VKYSGLSGSDYGISNPVWDKSGLRGYNAGHRLKEKTGWKPGGSIEDDGRAVFFGKSDNYYIP
jgi:hypothetical protein